MELHEMLIFKIHNFHIRTFIAPILIIIIFEDENSTDYQITTKSAKHMSLKFCVHAVFGVVYIGVMWWVRALVIYWSPDSYCNWLLIRLQLKYISN